VVVHIEPVAGAAEDLLTTVRVLAARHGLGAHGVRIYEQEGKRSIELHLEVSESLRLQAAHRQVTLFEDDLRAKLPGLAQIVSHIEPAGEVTATIHTRHESESAVREAIHEYLAERGIAVEPHEVNVQRTGGEVAVSFHCTLAPETSIADAHELTEQLEKHLRARLPDVGRVVIHVEPTDGA
jgi:divalent metal cation (Fe/Co/Zn/Cd) transporter